VRLKSIQEKKRFEIALAEKAKKDKATAATLLNVGV
jgi:hypothetical protein